MSEVPLYEEEWLQRHARPRLGCQPLQWVQPWWEVVAVSSHESATFRGVGGHFSGRVARLATR